MMEMNKESPASFASIVINVLIGEYFAETHSEPLCPNLGFKKIKSSPSTISPAVLR